MILVLLSHNLKWLTKRIPKGAYYPKNIFLHLFKERINRKGNDSQAIGDREERS
jgi:hypothetical protein